MSDILEDDLEFRGGTLQLSTDNSAVGVVENQPSVTTDSTRKQSQGNVHPSVLSGADSLTSSTNSFADARTQEQQNASGLSPTESQTVYPRYDVPFNKENIKDFFTFRKGVVEAAIQECITILLFPEDGEYLGSWLLTEITLWDNEKERIVLLTSRLVMTIKYDFIAMKQLDFKKTYLDDLDTIVIGELVYPPSSLVPRINGLATGVSTVVKDCVIDRLCRRPSTEEVPEGIRDSRLFDTKYFEPRERNLRGVRLMWNKGEPLPLKTVWNPFSQDVPFLTFASHPIYWHKDGGVEERATYDMETFAQKLQRAIEIMPSSSCCIHHSPIVIQSYVGLTSMLHNKTSMGFFKVRGKFSF
ncbi:tumor protein p63-regulated gene 1-like protein isoform X1 [Bombyx mandarina]|uniref:HSac2 domain-containing protein n=2 Tax=Bombyx TaxID=7090 RepID=A0A8R1WGV0_BOMMO|nr:tumor protein p63-regulated gene 1-like protein isoform X1 [Bombyx mori]XP_028038273.1 tumor protein p63-regulated gene 1-like protein isoform X1 [Bombyx mandarina]